MSFTRALVHNTLIQIIGRGINTVIGIGVLAIMARSLGAEGFGGYTTIISFLQFAAILLDFGLTLTGTRMLGAVTTKEQETRLVGNLLSFRLISAVTFLCIAPIIALWFPYTHDIKTGIAFTTLAFLATLMTQTMVPVFQKYLHMERVVIAEVIGKLILFGGVVIAASAHASLLTYMAIVVLGNMVNWLVLRIFTRRILPYHLYFDWTIWRSIIRTTWPIAVSILFNLIYLRADTLIISIFQSNNLGEVGLYGAAYRVLDILTNLATAFMGLLLPALTALWVAKHRDDFSKLFQKGFNAYILTALPTVAIGILLGRPLMALVAGPEFARAGDILAILIIAMGGVYFSTFFGHLIVAIEKQKQMIFGYAATAVIGLTAYLITIPRYGVWGAAWSTVGTEFLILMITAIVFTRTTKITPRWNFFGKALVATLGMVIFLYTFRTSNVVLVILGGCVIYSMLLIATRAITKTFLRELIQPKP